MELLVIISNSVDVLWCISDIGIVGSVMVRWGSVSLELIAQLLVVTFTVLLVMVALGLEKSLGSRGGDNAEIGCGHVAEQGQDGNIQSSFHYLQIIIISQISDI